MAQYCGHCGNPIAAGEMFCGRCGQKVSDSAAAPAQPGVYTQPPPAVAPAQPARPGVYTQPPPAAAPARRSPLGLILILAAVCLVAGGGALFVYFRFFAGTTNSNPTIRTMTTRPVTSRTTAVTGQSSATSATTAPSATTSSPVSQTTTGTTTTRTTQQTTAAPDWTDPETYMPVINQKYTYYVYYPDGTEGIEDVLVGHLEGRPLQTTAVLIPESEAYSTHVVRRADGLYSVADSDPGSRGYRFLPDKIGKGVKWENDGAEFEIVEIHASRQTSLRTFTDCIVVREEYPEADYIFRSWYAPGYGVVQSVYGDTGSLYQELTDVTTMKASDISKQLKKYAPNVSKIK